MKPAKRMRKQKQPRNFPGWTVQFCIRRLSQSARLQHDMGLNHRQKLCRSQGTRESKKARGSTRGGRATCVPNAAAQNAIQQQMRKFLEPMLKTELSFAARATDLNQDERRKLAADGKAWFEKFLVDFLKKQDPNQQQMLLQGMQGVWFGNQQQKAGKSARRNSSRAWPSW